MNFFNEWGKKISDAAEIATEKTMKAASTAAEKAKDLAEIAKLNNDCASEQRQMEKLHTELGKLVFEQEKNMEDSIYKDIIDKIKVHVANIDNYNEKITDLKNKPEVVKETKTEPEEQSPSEGYVDITPRKEEDKAAEDGAEKSQDSEDKNGREYL